MKFNILIFFGTVVPIGTAIAALTGLINVTPKGLVGAVWHGFPRVWLTRLVIAPQYYPWNVDALSLALDIAFWCSLAAVIQLIGVVLHEYSKRTRRSDATVITNPLRSKINGVLAKTS